MEVSPGLPSQRTWGAPGAPSRSSSAPATWAAAAHLSQRAWLEREVRQPEVRELVSAFIRLATYCNAPERLSAQVAVAQLQLALQGVGVLYLDRGWQTLVDGLHCAAEDAGARLETGAAVERIEHDGAARGVRLKDGSLRRAASVVVAAGPDVASSLIASDALRRWAEAAVPVRAACLDMGLRRLPNPRVGFVLGLDRPYYFSVHSRVAKLAPQGGATIQVAKYLPPDEEADPKALQRELESLLDIAQPGWREELVERRFLPDMIVVNALATAEQGGLTGRPDVEAPGVPGLYVVGDWVGGEGWLSDAALASAKLAAERILGPGAAKQAVRTSEARATSAESRAG